MLGSIVSGIGIVFPAGRTMRLVKNAINITIYANPVILTKNITLTILDCCTPPLAHLAGHCVTSCYKELLLKLQILSQYELKIQLCQNFMSYAKNLKHMHFLTPKAF